MHLALHAPGSRTFAVGLRRPVHAAMHRAKLQKMKLQLTVTLVDAARRRAAAHATVWITR
jgi:hypothetical protein